MLSLLVLPVLVFPIFALPAPGLPALTSLLNRERNETGARVAEIRSEVTKPTTSKERMPARGLSKKSLRSR
jgi:hypothetical protein